MWNACAPPRVSRFCGLVLACAAAIGALGCESAVGVGLGGMGSGIGYLVLDIRTDTPLASVTIGGWKRIPLDVKAGAWLRVVEVPAGRYRWSRLELPEVFAASYGFSARPVPLEFEFPYDDDLAFHVEPGRLNYVGLIEVSRSERFQLGIRVIDRTAVAIERLREEFPAMVERYPIVYAGAGRPVFLDRYRAAKGSQAASSAGAAP